MLDEPWFKFLIGLLGVFFLKKIRWKQLNNYFLKKKHWISNHLNHKQLFKQPYFEIPSSSRTCGGAWKGGRCPQHGAGPERIKKKIKKLTQLCINFSSSNKLTKSLWCCSTTLTCQRRRSNGCLFFGCLGRKRLQRRALLGCQDRRPLGKCVRVLLGKICSRLPRQNSMKKKIETKARR